MKTKSFILAVLLILGAAACQNDEFQQTSVLKSASKKKAPVSTFFS